MNPSTYSPERSATLAPAVAARSSRAHGVEPRAAADAEPPGREPLLGAERDHAAIARHRLVAADVGVHRHRQRRAGTCAASNAAPTASARQGKCALREFRLPHVPGGEAEPNGPVTASTPTSRSELFSASPPSSPHRGPRTSDAAADHPRGCPGGYRARTSAWFRREPREPACAGG